MALPNLLFSPQAFNVSWTLDRCTISADAAIAPNGTLTADKIVENTENQNHDVYQSGASVTNGVTYTLSVYVKAAERNYADICCAMSVDVIVAVNLTTGAVAKTSGNQTSTQVIDAGNGWWRVVQTFVMSTPYNFCWIGADINGTYGTYQGDGSSGIYIWGAQLEQGTLTDYSGVNLCLSPEAFNTTWQTTRLSVSPDATTNPNGLGNADKLIEDSSNADHYCQYTFTPSSVPDSQTRVFSCHLKAAERGYARLVTVAKDGSTVTAAYINLTTGALGSTVGTPNATITDKGNGWWRLSISASVGTGSSTLYYWVSIANASGNDSYQGDGTSGIYVWGAQIETNSLTAYPYAVLTEAALTTADAQLPVQRIAPASDVSLGNWTYSTGDALYKTIDEAVEDDSDYMRSGINPQADDACEVKLASAAAPIDDSAHVVSYAVRGSNAAKVVVELRCGTDVSVASWTHDNLSDSTVYPFNQTLTQEQVDLIASYSDLRLRFTAKPPA